MWVALWIVFGRVDLKAATKIRPRIFANSPQPEPLRERFLTEERSPLKPPFRDAFHPELYFNFPASFMMIRDSLWCIYRKSEPEEKDYHKLFNRLIHPFDKLLDISIEKAKVVPFVVQSGSRNHSNQPTVEVGEPRKKQKTEYTSHSMVTSQRN